MLKGKIHSLKGRERGKRGGVQGFFKPAKSFCTTLTVGRYMHLYVHQDPATVQYEEGT